MPVDPPAKTMADEEIICRTIFSQAVLHAQHSLSLLS